MPCQYVCKGFTWALHGTEFVTDALVLPLGGCDLVLGIQWLSTLGVIKWDFKQLRMEFTYKGRLMVLRGMSIKKPQLMRQEQLPKALKNASQLCML